MTRRSFLSRVSLGAAAVTLAVKVAPASEQVYPDRFDYRGWTVRWHNWRESLNQTIVFGVWSARPTTCQPHQRGHAPTTLAGYLGKYGELDVIDLTRKRDTWLSLGLDMPVTSFSAASQSERDTLKQRACRELLPHLCVLEYCENTTGRA